jgi:predicted FMN-binding regulatory protein PaiB
VIFHDYYSEIPRDEIDRFITTQEMGRLVTVSEDGTPHVGLYNFVYAPPALELHLVRADEQVADLKARPRCAFEVDEVLAVIPSHWVHQEYAGAATAYHRTVIFECAGTVAEDPAVVMAQQQRLLAKHQPEGQYRSLKVDDPLYKGALNQLAAVSLRITACRAKFKLGQNRPVAARKRVIEELRRRDRPNDARAADALQWTIDHPFTPGASDGR